ncbi:MAG TPA: ABC transporter permease [Puia sp.]|nr:ABC transporter permease [Puia sp.]
MLWTYLKIAYRNLKKNKLLTFINLFGLGLSMSVGMMEMVIMQVNLSYDDFHPHPERTYRITSEYRQNNGNHFKLASTPLPLYNMLLTDTDNIAEVVNLYPACKGAAKTAEGKELYLNGAFTEPSFFKVFGFTLAQGNPATALQQPNTLVLSATTARNFFGDEPALGKSIDIPGQGLFVVTGVLKEAPGKSHIDFDAYASASTVPVLEKTGALPAQSADWNSLQSGYTYVLLKNEAGRQRLSGQLQAIVQPWNKLNKNGQAFFRLQPMNKIRPAEDNLYNDIGDGMDWGKLMTGVYIGLIILIAACFNYTNLTIARALTRAKEVGVRKIVGARRYQVFAQYMVESLVQALLALAFAWLLLSFIIRYAPFNDGYEMIPSAWRYNAAYILCTVGFAVFTGLLAGVAPAWILSAFKPVRVLKNLSTARIFGKVSLQKSLIVFQYSLSLVAIIFLTSFYRQFAFLQSADPGFRPANVAVLPLEGRKPDLVASKIAMVSGVRTVSALSVPFTPHFSGMRSQAWVGHRPKDPVNLDNFFTDDAFIPSMNIRLIAGRNFGPRLDTLGEREIILNARATGALGFARPDDALGKKLWVNDSVSLEVIGIVGDFRFENAGKPIDPMAFRNNPERCKFLYIGTDGTDKPTMTRRMTDASRALAPANGFAIAWLDDTLAQNNSQRATISLLGYLAFIALGIATLGLLGLVIYTVETRRKETGIRKVIGASSRQLVLMLSGRFIKLLLIAGAIAVPIGYTMSIFFLQNFVQRVGNGLLCAIACFLFLLLMGLITILSQTWRASLANPVDSLRTE